MNTRRVGKWGLLILLGAWWASSAAAVEITLKNGTVLQGRVSKLQTLTNKQPRRSPTEITIYPIIMVADELQRYYVPYRQVPAEKINNDAELSRQVTFTLPQASRGRSRQISAVGGYVEITPFDENGRRRVTLQSPEGQVNVIQGVSKITPEYLKIVALNYGWETAIATSSVPHDVLDAMLRKATKPNNPDHRLGIAKFYLQATQYKYAQQELVAIRDQFPELVDTVTEVSRELWQLQAQQLLDELKLRRSAGQYQLCRNSLKQFPTQNVGSTVLRQVRELTAEFEEARQRMEQARLLMGELQATLPSGEQAAAVAPLRAEVAETLNYANLDRLTAFLQLSSDPKLSPQEKLALALSGWVLGSENAVTDLELSIHLWQARTLILDILRTTPDQKNDRLVLIDRLREVEGIGIERVSQMLPLLPPALDASEVEAGVIAQIPEVQATGKSAVDYSVLLPLEYNPSRSYPLIVALHSQGRTPTQEIEFWGGTANSPGQSLRHGYIVIAPAYATADERIYDYSSATHQIVLDSLRDACRRFHVDCDRVFLTGHGMGGDAVFDIGFSHPDLFAGLIPISGVSDKYCQFYWQNARQLPVYAVGGELERDLMTRNSREFMRMMQHGYDVIYTEYIGVGPDSFYAEIHKLFSWMSRQRRPPLPRVVEAKTLRATDTRFWWFDFEGLPAAVVNVDWSLDSHKRRTSPMSVSARLSEKDAPYTTLLISSGADINRIWLSPQLFDFEKRLTVRVNGKIKWNAAVKPDLPYLLEDFRIRGDRQRLYWALLEF